MGCGCGSAKEQKKSYSIIDVVRDELTGKAEKVSKYKKAKRLLACYACESLMLETKQCKKCGCFVQAKVLYKKSSCPVDKW